MITTISICFYKTVFCNFFPFSTLCKLTVTCCQGQQELLDNFQTLIQRDDVTQDKNCHSAGLHKLCYPTIRDRSTWSKFGAHGEHGDVFLFSNLGEL